MVSLSKACVLLQHVGVGSVFDMFLCVGIGLLVLNCAVALLASVGLDKVGGVCLFSPPPLSLKTTKCC